MPQDAFDGLKQGKFVERLRTPTGAQVTDFNLHEAKAPSDDHPVAQEDNEAFLVTEPNMEHPVGAVLLQNIDNGSAEIAIETPDGHTMEESLMRRALPAAMRRAKVKKATLDTQATNVPLTKLTNAGFSKKGDEHTIHTH